jgi:hypothetical protein
MGHERALNLVHVPGQTETPRLVKFADFSAPRFLITVDTEEEFDWSQPFQRAGYGTLHVPKINRFQQVCDAQGIQPVYLIDYPIACDPVATELFREWLKQGRCEIGAQLHAWVTPPFEEEVSSRNSYASNLDLDLEERKLQTLFTKIESQFGIVPQIYRAGRYGARRETIEMLRKLGVKIDSSARPLFDYRENHGPDYMFSSLNPSWLLEGEMFELPLTSVFSGPLRSEGRRLFSKISNSQPSRAFLARTKLLERLALTPEGIPLSQAIQAIDIAIAMGLPVLNFSFHSPSLVPGNTPYVRDEKELEQFYAWWDGVLMHLKRRGVQPTTSAQLIAASC